MQWHTAWISKNLSVLTSLTCEGHSLPLQTSSHENTGSPAASTEITVDREKEKRGHIHTEYTIRTQVSVQKRQTLAQCLLKCE